MKKFTSEELARFDGREGRPAYVAVKGKVYDVTMSSFWAGGGHMKQHMAGQDLTDAMPAAPHGEEVLDRAEAVGTLAAPSGKAAAPTPGWALTVLGFNPHPISVHFPQALLALAPFFLVLHYLSGEGQQFERTAYHLLVAGFALSFPTVATGFFHWIYKYGKSGKGLFRFKIIGSFVLLPLAGAAALVHTIKGPLPPDTVDFVLLLLYFLLVPVIISLGHAGGKIVFGGGR